MLDYHRVWTVMNELETIVSKLGTIEDLADAIYDANERKDYHKVENLTNLVKNYTRYVLEDYDVAFATAWSETVTKLHSVEYPTGTEPVAYAGDDESEEARESWNDFWRELETK